MFPISHLASAMIRKGVNWLLVEAKALLRLVALLHSCYGSYSEQLSTFTICIGYIFWLICCNSFLSFRKSIMRRSKVYDFAQKYKSPLNLWNLNCYSYSLGRIWSLDAFFVKSRFLIEILSLEYQNTER